MVRAAHDHADDPPLKVKSTRTGPGQPHVSEIQGSGSFTNAVVADAGRRLPEDSPGSWPSMGSPTARSPPSCVTSSPAAT